MTDKGLTSQELQEQVKSLQDQVKHLEGQLKDKDKEVSEPQPQKEPQPEKEPQPQPQLVDSPLIRGMDSANATAAKVLFTRGNKEFIDHVFTDQDTGKKLSYAEMRMMYG
jgi:hypothetical protein